MIEQTLAGKVALVSGAAWGIGAAICVELGSKYVLFANRVPRQARQDSKHNLEAYWSSATTLGKLNNKMLRT